MSEVIYDEKLRFKVDDCEGPHYFIGNPHTYHGRILGWCPEPPRDDQGATSFESNKYK